MPLTANLIDLRAMPGRRTGPQDDDTTAGLLEGLQLEGTEGVEFPVGGANQRRGTLRDRASTRGLKMLSRTQTDEQGRVLLPVQWYREQDGDLRVSKPAKRGRAAR